MKYSEFLESKKLFKKNTGISDELKLNKMLFDFQHDIVNWALKKGTACIFADCGMGKTPMQLEWAKHVYKFTNKPILILAPLAVADQTVREGVKFKIKVKHVFEKDDLINGINITNYERIDKFDLSIFGGIVLDESSILKNYTGKFRNQIIDSCKKIQFKLACTATPAPNDFMELGNHSEFVGAMSRTEMLSMFFVHDGGETQKWRLKGHAKKEFWKWVCSWAVMIRKPSDLGYDDGMFILPELIMHESIVKVDSSDCQDGLLLRLPASTLQERQKERKLTIDDRCKKAAEIINSTNESWLIWCNLNDESSLLNKYIKESVEVTGSDKNEVKAKKMLDFSEGKIKRLISKPKLSGFGMNWQHCSNMIFVGLSDSYEQFYQAVRRCWRFGQKKDVNCYIITAETEGAIVSNIKRKEKDSETMANEMVKNMHVYNEKNIKGLEKNEMKYKTENIKSKAFDAYLGDSCEVIKEIDDNSIHYSIFSPPFASLYTYSNSDRDMGNCKTDDEFIYHFKFLVNELFRIIQPGRLVSFHCMNLPTSKTRDGFIGIKDFRGELIKMFQDSGFIYHSEVCIWKDPVIAMQRTKALGLLHKQVVKDSCMSRQGIPDYLVTMRKPGNNQEPVTGELKEWAGDNTFQNNGNLSIDIWQRYASPVWMDINPSNTLQHRSAREHEDERHICPLQLDVIERGLQLWTNENDVVFSPFMGIGSEGYVSIKNNRRFIGIELKESYYNQAVKNLNNAEIEFMQNDLFNLDNDKE